MKYYLLNCKLYINYIVMTQLKYDNNEILKLVKPFGHYHQHNMVTCLSDDLFYETSK